ncbi:uncharacterized protein LOC131893049 [Tigriopus californicus]|uniref:uncharacterized protein LOC131893049 n=1 Tax=Tigriopus californicus TaxID=6832 RepID=UPI0027DA95E6|nr:uncharacterized protein LOC131893049 [Tigriopus californicus]
MSRSLQIPENPFQGTPMFLCWMRGSVQQALTYVNGRARKLKRINYPTSRMAMHNSLIWLFAKGAMKTLPCGMFGLAKDIRLAKLWGSTPPTHHNLDRVSRLLDKGAKIVNGVINTTLVEITHAADHEITMARECNDNGFEMVQDFKGDDLYSQHALKRVEKLKRNKKQPPSTRSLRPFSGEP